MTQQVTQREARHEWFCAGTEAEIRRMADVAAGADPEALVPECTGWTLARLVKHTGIVHRWATAAIATRATERLAQTSLDVGLPPDTAGYPSWLASGAAPLVTALREAGPDTAVWAWGGDHRSGWWARRMLHETTVHRADTEAAGGIEPDIDPGVAADGIDEFLSIAALGGRPSKRMAELAAGPTIHLHATDGDGEWLITWRDGGFTWSRGHARATAAVRAPVALLLRFTYGRVRPDDDRLAVFGDTALLTRWQDITAL